MRIAGEHHFAAPRDRIWQALHDPGVLARTLPGARRLEAIDEDPPGRYAITVDVGVGSVKGTYEGTLALTDEQPPEACTVRASAAGRPGTVETVARMRLGERDGGGTLLAYEADATVTGPIAGVGQRLVAGAARRNTERFLGALDRALVAPAPHASAPPEAGAPTGAATRPAAADPRLILAGAAAALLGVAVGRWTARR